MLLLGFSLDGLKALDNGVSDLLCDTATGFIEVLTDALEDNVSVLDAWFEAFGRKTAGKEVDFGRRAVCCRDLGERAGVCIDSERISPGG